MKYLFKAKDLKTGNWVTGDLAYANSHINHPNKIKPMIVKHCIHGGMIWITTRYFIDEATISLELIKDED